MTPRPARGARSTGLRPVLLEPLQVALGLDQSITEADLTEHGATYDAPVVLTMYSPTQGASIAYTTDTGDNPHWKLYAGPITVRDAATIRAKAIRYGYKESQETVATVTTAPAE